MTRTKTPAVALAEQLCRPQRIGVFGHRGVGKTTLLTILYREAVAGRLAGLRLAAADARTAEYLSDKVLQLEAGQPLPATLGETELRFHLYHEGRRLDLLVMDYQGEHVALGREEPIREFLRQCDAVWLCLDVPATEGPESCLRAEQEVEQLVEDYLSSEPHTDLHRPMALVLTKADLLSAESDAARIDLATQRFAMTRHALQLHCPKHGFFAVSSLGGPAPQPGAGPFVPRPLGLDGPLTWLATALQAQDVARLNTLWNLAKGDVKLLARCVACFARRYPDALETKEFAQRLAEQRRARRRRWIRTAVAAAAGLVLSLWTYDVLGEQQAQRFADANPADLVAVREQWLRYQTWHPTRHWLRPGAAQAERERLRALAERIREHDCAERLTRLRHLAANFDADPDTVWAEFRTFRTEYPDHDVGDDLERFHTLLKERRARSAFEDLERIEQRADLPALVEQASRFLRDHTGTTYEAEVRRRRATYLSRIDERDIQTARAYSAREPLHFHTRREHYHRYLEHHPEGAFVKEAMDAIQAIDADWDKNDFRVVRDHFQANAADVKELAVLCRSYLAAHPQGRFRSTASDLLRWTETVTQPGEYKVTLRSGQFDAKAAHFFSRGPSLSVEIEVNGVRYGPSNIVKRRYDPD
jgi:hypothetical protein